jgi:hypothetical protein
MDEAAPQAAESKTADEQPLEVLRLEWGRAYWIGRDAVRDGDFPLLGTRKVCSGRIRLESLLQMEWQHDLTASVVGDAA